ncbi:AMP phosphorylase [Candidatus Pacearchaeota archaeon]|nr:AMP phosphorylase [Candidatus Pacearchaeota archaeon]
MKLKIKKFMVDAGRPVVFMHENTARNLDVHVGDRVEIQKNKRKIVAVVDLVIGFLNINEIALSRDILNYETLKSGDLVDVKAVFSQRSSLIIAKKMQGEKLSKKDIYTIIEDIVNNILTEPEIAYFVSAVYEKCFDIDETIYLTEAIYKTGNILSWKNNVVADKHSIGGIPGNRTSPIVVSICAAAGLTLPKTSSRAITSAAGTADVMEVITKVDLESSNLKKIVEKTGACLAWGGSLGLAPADDKLIKVERILNVDPESQLIASIIAKKLAVGSKYVLIDIPYGDGAKVSKSEAEKLKRKFLIIAKHFRINMKVVLTLGNQPIGDGIGPVLEIIDVLKILNNSSTAPKDLEDKSIFLAGEILEMTGKSQKGSGKLTANQILYSGKALKKFNEIINAQGRKKVKLSPAKFKKTIFSKKNGTIKIIDNKIINIMGRKIGCPADKRAGLYIHKHLGNKVKRGDELLTFYAESKEKLNDSLTFFKSTRPIKIN